MQSTRGKPSCRDVVGCHLTEYQTGFLDRCVHNHTRHGLLPGLKQTTLGILPIHRVQEEGGDTLVEQPRNDFVLIAVIPLRIHSNQPVAMRGNNLFDTLITFHEERVVQRLKDRSHRTTIEGRSFRCRRWTAAGNQVQKKDESQLARMVHNGFTAYCQDDHDRRGFFRAPACRLTTSPGSPSQASIAEPAQTR